MATSKQSIFCHHLVQNNATAKQNAKAADVCPDGKERVECKSTPSTIGKSMPNSVNITDGRGARMIRFMGVVIKVATNCPASIIIAIRHFLNSNKIPTTTHGTHPPT